jgi:hypothetical protein
MSGAGLRRQWFRRALLVSIVLAILIHLLEFKGFFAGAEGKVGDLYLELAGAPSPGATIVTVSIDDKDYAEWFDGKSPLDAATLLELVEAVQRSGAVVVGVDILTDSEDYVSPSYEGRTRLNLALSTIGDHKVPVVWAATAVEPTVTRVGFFSWLLGAHDKVVGAPGKVLGKPVPVRVNELPADRWGSPIYPRDEDRAVRRLPRRWLDRESNASHLSFAAKVAAVYCDRRPDRCAAPGASEEVYLSYRSNVSMQPDYRVRDLFGCRLVERHLCQTWTFNGGDSLKESIVLLGGTFQVSGDFHDTAAGPNTPGLIVNAHGVQAEVLGLTMHELARPISLMLDLLVGLAIGAVFGADGRWLRWVPGFKHEAHRSSAWPRTLVTLALAIVAVVASLVFLRWGILWVSWIGMVVVGVAWHIVWETRHMRMQP